MGMIQVYNIAELERVTRVPRTTIHCYLRLGLLPRPQKTAASRSLYTEDHVKILERIGELKKAGLSLTQIEDELQDKLNEASGSGIDLVAQEYERMHNRILGLAAQEFAAKGYKKTHVTTIIKKLGINASLFYHHFASKRELLAECVSTLHGWGIAYADSKRDLLEDSGERFMWLAFANTRVFNLGAAALAQIRVEGAHDDTGEVRKPVEEAWASTLERIMQDLSEGSLPGLETPVVPDELIASSLFGALDETMRSYSKKYSRREILRAHLWLFLAAQAARSGEIDIDSRLRRYDELLDRFASEEPPLPPALEL